MKYEMGVALYGCEPRILKYCIDTVEGRMKKESEDKWCDSIIRWCRFGVKRNACESMVEVWVENWGKWILDSEEKKLEKEFFFWEKQKKREIWFWRNGNSKRRKRGCGGISKFWGQICLLVIQMAKVLMCFLWYT